MRRLRVTIAVLAAGAVLALPGTAAAGGVDTLSFARSHHAPGMVAAGDGELMFGSQRAARRVLRRGELAVYLLPGAYVDRVGGSSVRWSGLPDGARRVGTASLRRSEWAGNVLGVRARFEVPKIAAGDYRLVVCAPGCRRLAGRYQWPTPFSVVATPTEARLLDRLDRHDIQSREQVGAVHHQVELTRRRLVDRSLLTAKRQDELAATTAALRDEVNAGVDRLDAELARVRRQADEAQAAAARDRRLLAGGIAALLVALAVVTWRRPALRAAAPPSVTPSPPGVDGFKRPASPSAAPDSPDADGFERPAPVGAVRRR